MVEPVIEPQSIAGYVIGSVTTIHVSDSRVYTFTTYFGDTCTLASVTYSDFDS